MSENMTPELTLNPTETEAAVPELTLDPTAVAEAPQEKPVEPVQLDDKLLTEQEKKAVEEFSKKIDITDTNMVLQYGAAAQKSVAGFSENALSNVRSKDLGEVGADLSELVVQLKGFGSGEEKKGLAGLFRKAGNKIESMKAQYGKVEANVDRIAQSLEKHQITLMKDIAMFDQMYELNLKYYKELTMYILAGKKRLEEVRAGELEELRVKAEKTGLAEDAQAYNDMVNLCNRFEKKLHDLELTRMISVQMGPQTRLLQNNDTQMVEKIQSSLVNTIPLWKSQMVLALGMEHGRENGKKVRQYFIQVEKDFNSPEKIMARALKIAESRLNVLQLENTQQKQLIGELKPKADYLDQILQSKALVTITAIAKDYGMSAKALNQKLHELKVQFKQGHQWFLYSNYHNCGYTHSETVEYTHQDGRKDVTMNTKWTQKGRLFLYDLLKKNGIVPMIEQ